MKIIKLIVRFQAQKACKLPVYKSPMLRGALGHSILESIEDNGSNYWNVILEKLFEDFFKGERGDKTTKFNSVKTTPHPFSIYCENMNCNFSQGDCFDFEFVIYGYAIIHLPMVLYSLDTLAENGLGKIKSSFKLVNARAININGSQVELFDNGKVLQERLSDDICHEVMPPNVDALCSESVEAIIKLKSPTRWSQGVNSKTEFVFYDFFKAVLRRVSMLSYFWSKDEWSDFEFKLLLDSVKEITPTKVNLEWVSYKRYSSVQDKEVLLNGWQGEVRFKNMPAGIADILKSASLVNIGKGAVFGSGKFSIAKFS